MKVRANKSPMDRASFDHDWVSIRIQHRRKLPERCEQFKRKKAKPVDQILSQVDRMQADADCVRSSPNIGLSFQKTVKRKGNSDPVYERDPGDPPCELNQYGDQRYRNHVGQSQDLNRNDRSHGGRSKPCAFYGSTTHDDRGC